MKLTDQENNEILKRNNFKKKLELDLLDLSKDYYSIVINFKGEITSNKRILQKFILKLNKYGLVCYKPKGERSANNLLHIHIFCGSIKQINLKEYQHLLKREFNKYFNKIENAKDEFEITKLKMDDTKFINYLFNFKKIKPGKTNYTDNNNIFFINDQKSIIKDEIEILNKRTNNFYYIVKASRQSRNFKKLFLKKPETFDFYSANKLFLKFEFGNQFLKVIPININNDITINFYNNVLFHFKEIMKKKDENKFFWEKNNIIKDRKSFYFFMPKNLKKIMIFSRKNL
jgi:hypothetical protein